MCVRETCFLYGSMFANVTDPSLNVVAEPKMLSSLPC